MRQRRTILKIFKVGEILSQAFARDLAFRAKSEMGAPLLFHQDRIAILEIIRLCWSSPFGQI
jgi:hypothetical protein